ncbi:MAG TPA: DUF268 domain-containing protein [Chlamydiales bacterium]|nr:DUF268 domain-containing protein [Chlamydiales bacterium]
MKKICTTFLWIAQIIAAEPPRTVPPNQWAEFTLNGQIPIFSCYRNDSYPPEHPIVYDFETVEQLKQKALAKERNYYGETDTFLYAALEAYPIRGKTVAIMGSNIPWYEAIVLAYGGKPVTIEYNRIVSTHSDLTVMTVDDYDAHPEMFDAVISISSYEHDGLGRYGDPIDPRGDLKAMERTKKMLRPEGVLFLAVPIGRDLLAWNVHRVYGTKRFPILIEGWEIVHSFGFQESDFQRDEQGFQPVFVLK